MAAEDVAEDARRNLDAALAADAAALKNALLKALRACALHRAFLGLPALLEETRRLLTAASAKLVATTLETELCADVEACEDARALGCVVEVLNVLLGSGKLKKELGGFDLSAPAKKSCRTALNKATRRLEAAQQQQRRAEAGRRRRQAAAGSAHRRPRRPAGGSRGGGGARGGARRRDRRDVRAGDGGEGGEAEGRAG